MTANDSPILPGRLGSPDMVLNDDPRADPRMIAALVPFGMGGAPEPMPVDINSTVDELHEFLDAMEPMYEEMFAAIAGGLPPVAGVTSRVEVIRGIDGNDITLFVHHPSRVEGPVPGMVHIHGGGMVFLEAAGAAYARSRDEIAATGMIVVGVEFRNGGGKQGRYPFPAGLNDCTSALQWVADNKATLGVSKIVVSGESGGGNLSLATTLKAKRDGRIDQIDGVYAECPYISNVYVPKSPSLPSLYENDGYFLECGSMGALAKLYDPSGENATNPLVWPYYASTADLEGLPPHVISVNQLDPLRDEGLVYFRKLLDAGVSAVSRTLNGTCHGGDCIFGEAMPDVHMATIRDIKAFADSL